jgi:hypothetical protein
MDTIKEFDNLNQSTFNLIKEYVQSLDLHFEHSLLYDNTAKEKLLDAGKRKSEFALIKESKLFDMFDQLVQKVNTLVTDSCYQLVRNDVMYIKYKKDDFFEPHTDFLTYKTNLFQEHTMILCLDADCTGGETIFHINPHFKHKCSNTIEPGKSVIFRKDFYHEGSPIKSGHKHILVVNLLETKKESDGYLAIRFKDNTINPLIIPTSNIFAFPNGLQKYVDKSSHDKIHIYESKYSYNQMKIIYDIMMRHHLSKEQYLEGITAINDFNINFENMIIDAEYISMGKITIDDESTDVVDDLDNKLVDKSTDSSSTDEESTDKDTTDESTDEESEKTVKVNNFSHTNSISSGNEIILFHDKNELDFYYQTIIKPQKMDYIPFTILFAEGQSSIDDSGISDISGCLMEILGEMEYIGDVSKLEPMNSSYNNRNTYDENKGCEKYYLDCDDCDDYYDSDFGHLTKQFSYDFKIFVGAKYFTNSELHDYLNETNTVTPGCNYENIKDDYDFENGEKHKFFSIDKKSGRIGFNKKQLKYVRSYWTNVKSTIIDNLSNATVRFPQILSHDDSGSLCNESYYGEFTLVRVSGLFKIK